jgi:hypothetical protein
MANVTKSFSLDTAKDADLLRWIDALERGALSGHVRQALRAYVEGAGVSLGALYVELRDIKKMLRQGARIVEGPGQDTVGEVTQDADGCEAAAANLAALEV